VRERNLELGQINNDNKSKCDYMKRQLEELANLKKESFKMHINRLNQKFKLDKIINSERKKQ
jgi:hypothetical protein